MKLYSDPNGNRWHLNKMHYSYYPINYTHFNTDTPWVLKISPQEAPWGFRGEADPKQVHKLIKVIFLAKNIIQ
jgi:hypothetical protein